MYENKCGDEIPFLKCCTRIIDIDITLEFFKESHGYKLNKIASYISGCDVYNTVSIKFQCTRHIDFVEFLKQSSLADCNDSYVWELTFLTFMTDTCPSDKSSV